MDHNKAQSDSFAFDHVQLIGSTTLYDHGWSKEIDLDTAELHPPEMPKLPI